MTQDVNNVRSFLLPCALDTVGMGIVCVCVCMCERERERERERDRERDREKGGLRGIEVNT